MSGVGGLGFGWRIRRCSKEVHTNLSGFSSGLGGLGISEGSGKGLGPAV